MSRAFPEVFVLKALRGQRAFEFTSEPEAFQALVGDLAKEELPTSARVTPLLGNDGEIDVYLERQEAEDAVAFGAYRTAVPAIIQCRYSERGERKALFAGWKKTDERLRNAAQTGWQGAYAPWKTARSYFYILGSRISSQATREDLRERICEALEEVLPNSTPALYLLDWGDLAQWLNRSSRLCDRWLGASYSGLKTHVQVESSLVRTRSYLRQEVLPFVGLETEWQPKKIVSLFMAGSFQAAVLAGPGGVGKTRVLFEVAREAERCGWRVLHLLSHSDPDYGLLYREVREDAASVTLMALDYADRLPEAFFDFIHELQDELVSMQRHLYLIASTRPARTLAMQGHSSRWRRFDVFLDLDQSRALQESEWMRPAG